VASARESVSEAATGARRHARAIVDAALSAVEPEAAVADCVSVGADALRFGDMRLPLEEVERIIVVGAGKAGVPMARALERLLGERIVAGHVVVPHGQEAELPRIRVHGAAHPVPDAAGVAAGGAVVGALADLDASTLVVCVISGGGSALLVRPAAGITLQDLRATNEALLACGANIVEINTLRKHLSAVKGGQLARAAAPARVVTLILSDVVGDPLDAIASGPTVPDTGSFADCLQIVRRYELDERLPEAVLARLRAGAAGEVRETPKPGDPLFERVSNLLVANNDRAVRAAASRAEELGFRSLVLSTTIEGETRDIARMHAAIAREVRVSGRPCAPPCCLISGGETTVTLRGDGSGGRNQEFVLAAAIHIDGLAGVTVCSVGTDGIDGGTDAAGAVADGDSVSRARAAGKDAVALLANNDSNAFFACLDDLVVTGPTDTNVMDLRLLLIE
jgi:hydroxypyruvate reductase